MNKFKQGFVTIQNLSGFLLAGTIIALIWINGGPEAAHDYHKFIDGELLPASHWLAHLLTHGKTKFNFHFVVNDLFMVLFFGLAAKEVSESFLPGGALSSVKKASMPAIATMGGVFGPIAMFFILKAMMGYDVDVTKAWAVPTATDIAYCWLFAGLIFGRMHPAVTFLLVLAVLDDLIGMMIIAVFYTPEVHPAWLGLVALAIVLCEGMRRFGVKSFWPYVAIGGPLCWFGLHNTGVHAALALVPVVPFMPHAERDAGLFVRATPTADHGHDGHGHGHADDTLNNFEHFFKPIVDVGLFTFGLANAGVVLSGQALGSSPTWIIFLSLLLGKTIGILLFSMVGKAAGLDLPKPMTPRDLPVLGCVAGIGFTVALFVTTVAVSTLEPELAAVFKERKIDEMLKLGALMSFAAGPIAFVLAKLLGLQRINTKEELDAAIIAAGGEVPSDDHGHDDHSDEGDLDDDSEGEEDDLDEDSELEDDDDKKS